MRSHPNVLGVFFACIVVLSFGLVYHKSKCRPQSIPGQFTNLNELLLTLHEWERQQETEAGAHSISLVAEQLERAIAAERQARNPIPPALLRSEINTDEAAIQALAISGTQCHVAWQTELWGEPVVWGSTHHTQSVAECCAACQAHQLAAARGGLEHGRNSTACNTWVFCGDKARCGARYQECWLKHQTNPPPADQPATGRGSAWTSGIIYPGDTWLVSYERKRTLTLQFTLGSVVVELLPDLAPVSVRELQRLAALLAANGGGCDGCRLYRVETNFLVQGVISHPGGYVASPRHPNPPQRKVMERGLVCWAGGAGGPDFFVNLIDQAGFGDDHLCWGLVRDMTLLDAIVKRPIKPKAKPNEMTFLADELRFNLTLS